MSAATKRAPTATALVLRATVVVKRKLTAHLTGILDASTEWRQWKNCHIGILLISHGNFHSNVFVIVIVVTIIIIIMVIIINVIIEELNPNKREDDSISQIKGC